MAVFDKKYHEGPYKTAGQAAVALDDGYHQEVGETLPGMLECTDKWLGKILDVHKKIDHYFLLLVRKKHAIHVNMIIQKFSIFAQRPDPYNLYKNLPLSSMDVFEVNKGDPLLLWCLPGPEAWDNILKNPEDHPENLVGWMKQFQDGTLV